jgi:hypothetical protein
MKAVSAAPSGSIVLRRATEHVEPFNGSDAMLSIGRTIDERKDLGPHQAILTLCLASDSMWTSTIRLALAPERS